MVWQSGGHAFTSRLEPGLGWPPPSALPGAEGHASLLQTPTVAVNGPGRALAVWSADDSPEANQLWANAFDPGEERAAPDRLGPEQGPSATLARVFLNAEGDGLVAWREPAFGLPGGGLLYASRYARATGFGPAEGDRGPSIPRATPS